MEREEIKFWQDKARHEVDFILDQVSYRIAVEAKFKTRLKRNDFKGLLAFKKMYPESRLFLINLGTQEEGELNLALPFGFWADLLPREVL